MMKSPLAVVYPLTTMNGYGAAWSLAKAGIPVVGLSSKKTLHAQSRLLKEYYETPSIEDETDRFVDFLIELRKKENVPMVLYMINDISAFVASAYRDELQPYYYYSYLEWNQLIATLEKRAMYNAAKASGMLLPRTWFPDHPLWAEDNSQNISYPVIIKPLVARFSFENKIVGRAFEFTAKYKKAIEIHNASDLCSIYNEINAEAFDVLVQERIQCKIDDLVTHSFYCEDGKIMANFVGRKLHQEPPDFGTGVICRAEINHNIIRESSKFVREIRYQGIGNIEYIETSEGYKFIEINPRPHWWNSLSTSCGVNFYKLMYDHLCGKEINLNGYQQGNRQLIWYNLGGLDKFIRYKHKRISFLSFLFLPKMEAVANYDDLRLSALRILGLLKNIAFKWIDKIVTALLVIIRR